MEKEKLNFYKVIIASYLHDIWKILWRWWFNRLLFNDEKKYNVAHAQHLRDFLLYPKEYFEKNKKTWFTYNQELDEFKNIDFWKDIVYIWSLHHSSDKIKYNTVFDYIQDKNEKEYIKKLVSIVYLSDNIASLDRLKDKNNIDGKELENKNIKDIWLWSIFENIFNFNKPEKNNYSFYPDILENIDISKENLNVSGDFKKISIKFLKELISFLSQNKEIYKKEEKDLKKFVYDLDLIFAQFTTLIPSDSFQWKTQDLSLYDHTKIVVTISSVLYKKFISWEKTNLSFSTEKIQEKEISLIAWDFPSIQKYIFDSIKKQKWISKRLRSKSFIVQILNEAIIEFLLEKIWYTRANVLINAWWKFVIICDKIDEKEVTILKENINYFLLTKYSWNIKFSLISKNYKIWEVFANNTYKDKDWKYKNFSLEKVKSTFVELFESLSQDKFSLYTQNNLRNIFENKNISWKIMCKYCWQNYLEKKDCDENDDENICKICENEKYIWENLVKNKDIFVNYIDKNKNFDFSIDFEKGSFKVLFNNWDYKKLEKSIWIWKSINLYVPKNEDWDTKDFETIIKDDKNSNWWIDYICMLKWDIDAMSLIFKHWFDFWERLKKEVFDEKLVWNTMYSVNRLTQFSRFLELFFGTYLDKKIEERFKNVYTVFSWWDDFVFIVPFLQRQDFINFLYEEFYNFIWKNEKIHFSIWLGIFKDKTPFKTMNDETEELLKRAKEKSKEKNIIKDNLWKILWTIKDSEWLLRYRGLTIYEENFTQTFIDEEINFIQWIEKWDKNFVPEEKRDSQYNYNINNLELSVWDTQMYTIYSELTRFRDIYKQDNIDYSETILIWARILNMLSRNSKETRENLWFQNLKKDISDLIWKIEIWKQEKNNKIGKIDTILLWIVDNIYKNRYKNTK